ncbi:endonuclease domain-containing protein [Microbacterium pygmaeum]|uniref:DUF559 domain-containing protein n=1 Tax=Microbacterium pygmaeum TaxID=370764 RepID=A0A1G8D0Q4_9MICO|nr:DUF559 domain-containing protein [Microbacterium pygmaeum]SDH51271.1 Protein of unknown function [Microbacterium pygmaeum]
MELTWNAYSRAELCAHGFTRRSLARALESGELLRVRRDRYVRTDIPAALQSAVRIGGRATCLTLLQMLGVFVFQNSRLHVHVPRGSSRLRSPGTTRAPLAPRADRAYRLHWMTLARQDEGTSTCVGVLDALIHAVICQPARYAIATLDSALHAGLIDEIDMGDIFAALPARFQVLRPLINGRAESGPETLVRLILRGLGCDIIPQVTFDGIGRVDLLVDGWLVIECDSREFHEAWEQQAKDRERDLRLAARGYATLRLTAAVIMTRPDDVIAAIRGMLTVRGVS